DPKILKSASFSLKGAVVVLDEAHNIESVCRDAGSIDIGMSAMYNLAGALCILSTKFLM
ncbi:unnamed protein product, partial [Choristocarpus tenellus]